MAVTADVWSWSSSEASNSPAGGDTIGTSADDILRKIQAGVRAAFEPLTSVSGTNTITASMANLAAYSSGLTVRFIPANSNTGATTININSLGAKNIYLNGAALVGYELRANCPVQLHYDGTQFNLIAGAHGGDGVALGTVKDVAHSTVPNGWLECDGSAVSRTTYADLFALLSTTWGTGDGSTTFNLPDFRGRGRIGKGTGTQTASGTNSDVDTTADTLTVASNNTKWITGMSVVFTLASGTITGLTSGNTYYVIRSSATLVKLASSLANAQNGTAIDLTAKSSPVWTITHTLTARSLAEIGGEQSHAMSSAELLAHAHAQDSTTVLTGGGGTAIPTTGGALSQGGTTASVGGNAAMNVMSPFGAVMTIIKI